MEPRGRKVGDPQEVFEFRVEKLCRLFFLRLSWATASLSEDEPLLVVHRLHDGREMSMTKRMIFLSGSISIASQ